MPLKEPIFISDAVNEDWIKTPENRESEKKLHDDLAKARDVGEKKLKGGPGSGHHGHAGRPGQRGGSVPGSGGTTSGTVKPGTVVIRGRSVTLSKMGHVAPEDLPPPKEGYVRLYHTTTDSETLAIMEREGISTGAATGYEGPKGAIWATVGPDDYSDARPLVVFDSPETGTEYANSTDRMVWVDIPPDDILATYPMLTISAEVDAHYRLDRVIEHVLPLVKREGIDHVLSLVDEGNHDIIRELAKVHGHP